MATMSWKYFACTRNQLCIDTVLAAGQSFRWKQNHSGEWLGVMAGLVWRLKQTDDKILYQVYGPDNSCGMVVNNGVNLKRADENKGHTSNDFKNISDISGLKQKFSNCEGPIAIKTELDQDDEAMEFIKCGISEEHSQNYKKVCCKRNQKVAKGFIEKQNTNHRIKSRTKEASVEHDILSVKMVTGEEKIVKQELEEEPVSQVVSSGIGHIKDGVAGSCHHKLLQEHTTHFMNDVKQETHNLQHNHTMDSKDIAGKPFIDLPEKANPNLHQNYTKDIGSLPHDHHYKILHNYFQLAVDLDNLYTYWSSKDSHFGKVGGNFKGIRILQLDPTECLLSFVCSSNNHISRISSMVEKLCTHYGDRITSVDSTDYHSFPSFSALCGADVESHLRELGFGYRAKFIASIAKHVTHEKEDGWLESLREKSYSDAKSELMTLLGVGAKVADCVCLMSLDKTEALPVDTHVWQITLKHYLVKLHSAKSLTERLYNEIGDFYRTLWGPYAGWTQAVLFTAHLRHNKERNIRNPDLDQGTPSHDGSDVLLNKSENKRKQNPKPAKGLKKKK